MDTKTGERLKLIGSRIGLPQWLMSTFGVIVFIALWIIATGVFFVFYKYPGSQTSWEAAGQTGDYVGGWLGAFFGLASAVLFLGAILLQRDELTATREQLKLSLNEMEMARAVHQEQAEHLEKQTEIARHSAHVSRTLETINRFHECQDQFTHLYGEGNRSRIPNFGSYQSAMQGVGTLLGNVVE